MWYNLAMKNWIKNNTTSLAGVTVAITGATGGLGVEICKHLASCGANLILINRNLAKTEQLKNELLKTFPNIVIDIIVANLCEFESVKNATEQLKQYKVDVLILNAGIYCVPRYTSDIGYDNVFTTNFVSHYYMVKQLLPTLKKSDKGRVVAVGSIAHNYTKLNEGDVDFASNPKHSKVYGNSKRFLMFALYELFKGEDKVKLSVVHPGVTFTNITNHYPKLIYALIKYPMKFLFPSPKRASLNILAGVFRDTDYHCWIGPKIFNVWGKPKLSKLKTCSIQESSKIFKISENIYNKIIK